MNTYYLCAEKSPVNGSFTLSVRDNSNGCEVLKAFQAENYPDAVKMFSFTAKSLGKTVFCGVSANGKPFHGEE